MKKILTLALTGAAALGAVATTAAPADAQWRHGGGYHHGWRGGWRGPAVVYGYSYGYGCRVRLRWDPYYGRYIRVRVCY